MKTIEEKENGSLNRLNFITSLGDWFSYFAVLNYVFVLTKDAALASSVVTIKSLSILISALIFPWMSAHCSVRRLLIVPEIVGGVCSLAPIALFSFENPSMTLIFGLLFAQSLLKEIFNNAKDSYSKLLRTDSTHLTFQAQILNGQFLAQFIGPLSIIFLVRVCSIQTILSFDALTFFYSAYTAYKLTNRERIALKKGLAKDLASVFSPLFYARKIQGMSGYLLMRSVIFWIGTGMSNFFGVGIVATKFNLSLVNSAWTYFPNGLGAAVSSFSLKNKLIKSLSKCKLTTLAWVGLSIMGVVRLFYSRVPYFWVVVVIYFFNGLGMGAHSVSTLTMRSKLTTKEQFAEVMGLETCLGRFVDFLTQCACIWAVKAKLIDFEMGLWVAGVFAVVSSLGYLKINLPAKDNVQFS
ncbi:MAG: MFS transporter [Chryseobacterium sp.]